MRGRIFIGVMICSLASAVFALTFQISNNYVPNNAFFNKTIVNAEHEPLTYALGPGPLNSMHEMKFPNAWTEWYFIQNKNTSVPWEVVPGSAWLDIGGIGSEHGIGEPMIVDLGKNGIRLGERGVGVSFDIDADGEPDRIQWVRQGGDEAFLVLDRNEDGKIDSGSELFGNHTPLLLQGGRPAADGFQALAQYDNPSLGGNGDGRITQRDSVWSKLLLWRDRNADGISATEEIKTLDAQKVGSLSITPSVRSGTYDFAGNWLPLWGWASSLAAPHWMSTVDVWFVDLPST